MSDKPELYCGVDAGGTSTRALVADLFAARCGWASSEGANPTHAGWESAGRHMDRAIQAACARAGCAIDEIRSVFLGVAGVISESDRASTLELSKSWNLDPSCKIAVDHDIRTALESGLRGEAGIALIAGTGSSCYGRNDMGVSWQAGGWDELLDDLGSGYDLAKRGMAAACQSADGRLPATELQQLIFDKTGVDNVIDFSVKVHRPRMPRDRIAALAPLILEAATEGDKCALQIVAEATDELSRMVEAVTRRLFPDGNPKVVLIGGLLEKSESYRKATESAIRRRLPNCIFTELSYPAVAGAWSLAAKQIGVSVSSDLPGKIMASLNSNAPIVSTR